MNTNSENLTDLSGLEMDLLKSFQPSWVKESTPSTKLSSSSTRSDDESMERVRPGFDRDDSDSRWDHKRPKSDRISRRPSGEKFEKSRPRPSDEKRATARPHGPRRDDRQGGSRRESDPAPRPIFLEGWEVKFLPEPRGVEGLLKQIKSTVKTYSLFELARLVLEKSARYLVEFQRTSGPALFQVSEDGTLWLSESEAAARVLAAHLDKFYRCERIDVEPPKGAHPIIAQCGMSGVLLGPPNLHDYQLKVQKLHTERFSNVAFDIYKARIRMVRDEESVQKWRDQQSSQEVYFPLETPEGTEPTPLKNLVEVAEHFQKNHAARVITKLGDQFIVPGSAPVNDSAPPVIEFTRRELDSLIRFPLPLANVLSQKLAAGGLQIFKAHENITYVSVARPKTLDRQANPVSESLAAILDYLESNAGKSRAEQWKALLELPTLPSDAALRESALLRDFHWLLLQGHVIDFASKGLEIPRRPSARPPQDRQEKSPNNHPPRPVATPKAPRSAVIVPQTPKPNLEPPAELSKVELDSDALQPDESEALPSGPEALPQVADVLPDAADVLPQVTATLSEETDLASESIEPLPEAVETPAEAGDFLSELETAVQDTPTLEGGETTTQLSRDRSTTEPLS
jgi:hypothetical protein